jgi:glycosyltransferase involved in cell wall biosynthesis
MNSTDEILVSIITVCYNAADSIEKTIISVLSQSHQNIEYIIVDGKSSDDTIDIVKKYEKKISKIISEADDGIYHAMNKAVKYAHGDWIYFLNSGDLLYNNEIVQNVMNSYIENKTVEIIYGDIVVYDHGDHELQEMYRSTSFHIMTRGGINHQAIFAKTKLFQQSEPFDLNYRVFADYNWLLKSVYVCGAKLHYISQPIALYQKDGFSKKNLKKCFPERLEIIIKYWRYYNFRSVLRSDLSELLYFGILLIYLRLPYFSKFFEYLSKILKITTKTSNPRM